MVLWISLIVEECVNYSSNNAWETVTTWHSHKIRGFEVWIFPATISSSLELDDCLQSLKLFKSAHCIHLMATSEWVRSHHVFLADTMQQCKNFKHWIEFSASSNLHNWLWIVCTYVLASLHYYQSWFEYESAESSFNIAQAKAAAAALFPCGTILHLVWSHENSS